MNISKFFKIKGIGFILLAFAAGIILLLLPSGDTKDTEQNLNALQYVSIMEETLEEVLSSASGYKCEVMISLSSGYSFSYAANETLTTTHNESGPVSKTASKEYVITSKNGEESLVVIKENLPEVQGVAVVCKGGGEWELETIRSVVSALFDLPYENIGCVIAK